MADTRSAKVDEDDMFADLIAKLNFREVEQMPKHDAFIARHCAAPAMPKTVAA